MDATLNGTWLEDRFGDPFVFGVQGGAYLGDIVRLAIRLEMPTDIVARALSAGLEAWRPAPVGAC